jgi:adenine phosphoribosyltransferase
MDLKQFIRNVPDFPKPGVTFRDISPLLANADAWAATVHQIADRIAEYKPDLIAGIESRGFLVAAPLALQMELGFVMIRKLGKLPGMTKKKSYNLEYGSATLEVQEGLIQPGQRIVVVDDILATGGTMNAAIHLLRQAGGAVKAAAFIIELEALKGRDNLDIPAHSLIQY